MSTQNIKDLSIKINSILDTIRSSTSKEEKENNFQKLITLMESSVMKCIFKVYLEDAEKDNKNLSDDEKDLLLAIIRAAQSVYNYSGMSTGLSDTEYDYLNEYLKEISDKEIITESVARGEEVEHHKFTSLRGTLDKIYKLTEDDVIKNKSQKTIDDWIKKSENKYREKTGEDIDLYECDVIVMPKFDGVSCVFECSKDGKLLRALTRGDTSLNEAQNITHIVKDSFIPPFTDAPYEYAEKTEIMMLDEDLEKFNQEFHKDYKNTRSIVSSILNSDERDVRADYLKVIPLRYSYLVNGVETEQHIAPGMYDFPYLKCKLKELDKIREFSITHKTVYPGFRCDGSVIYIIDEKVQKVLGRENEKQKFEVAFKFTEETAYSKVKDIEFTMGSFGRINPVVKFKPIKMKGNKVEKASLGSYARFKELELAKGDIVKVMYDIIPYADFIENDPECKRSLNQPIKEPTICPECGEPFTLKGDILYCMNKNCPCRQRGKILNYCIKMNIGELSEKTIEKFYNEGLLRDIADIYKLEKNEKKIISIPGFSYNKIANILSEINSHRTVDEATFLGSLGIEGVSKKTFGKVLEYVKFTDLLDYALSEDMEVFLSIPGIQEITARKIIDGIKENEKMIDQLSDYLDIIPYKSTSNAKFTVAFTKVRDHDLEKYIEDLGGITSDDVTKNTNFLVVPNASVNSSKTKKAAQYNIPIIEIGAAKKFLSTYVNLIK